MTGWNYIENDKTESVVLIELSLENCKTKSVNENEN